MTSYRPGDLVLVTFPLTAGTPGKQRPALVLLDTGDADFLAARVTMQPPHTSYDVPLAAWQAAGLLGPSTVRLHKQATLEKAGVSRVLGHLNPADRPQVARGLAGLYAAGW